MSDSRGKSATQRTNKPLDRIPRPEGHLFTIKAASQLVGRTERTIYNVLSKYAERFEDPMYQKGLGVPSRRWDERLYRVLSPRDMGVLRTMFSVYVKRKVRSP